MNLNIFEKLQEKIKENNEKRIDISGIDKNEVELAQKLDAIEEYVIDRFEEDIAVLENRENQEMKNITRDKLPEECKEGDIIKCINGKYFLDKEETEIRKEELENKYKDLWK